MKRVIVLLILSVGVIGAQTKPAQRQKATAVRDTAIDPKARAALDQMAGFLKTAKTFKLTATTTREELVDHDMKVQKNGSGELLVRLPDRLQALIRTDDGRDYELFYNGQTITLYSPKENYYATAPAPPTVARMLDAIQARYGIVLPLADFIHMAAAEDLYQNITAAGHVGVSRIDGVECDHLAVRQPNVDWQVWIEKTNTPVPRKIVITTKKQPTQPQYESTLKWDLTPEIDGDVFTFDIPPDAARIKFAVRNQK